MLRHASLLIILLCLVIVTPASAQEVQRITFNDAVQIALEKNVALRRAANNVDFDAIALSRQRSNFLPDLSLNTNGSNFAGRTFNQEDARFVNETTQSLNASASSNITLFQGMGRVASYREARNSLEARDFDFERQRQTVVFSVMSRYLSLLERQQQIEIQRENLDSQTQQLEQIEEFVNVGQRPISELYQQQAATASAELNLLNAERDYQISEVNLIQVLQLDPFGAYEFAAPEVNDGDLIGGSYSIETMLREAYGQRLDLKARETDIVAAEEGIRAAKSGFWPSLSLRLSTGSRADSRNPASFSDQFTDIQRSSSIGFNVGIPIFDRFSTRNNIEQSRVQYRNAQLNLEDLQQNIALDVRQAYLDYLTAEKSLDVTEKQELSAQQALTAEQERYNVGAATLVELSQARAAFVQAASNRNQARFDFIFQKKLIDYYMGKLNPTETLFN